MPCPTLAFFCGLGTIPSHFRISCDAFYSLLKTFAALSICSTSSWKSGSRRPTELRQRDEAGQSRSSSSRATRRFLLLSSSRPGGYLFFVFCSVDHCHRILGVVDTQSERQGPTPAHSLDSVRRCASVACYSCDAWVLRCSSSLFNTSSQLICLYSANDVTPIGCQLRQSTEDEHLEGRPLNPEDAILWTLPIYEGIKPSAEGSK